MFCKALLKLMSKEATSFVITEITIFEESKWSALVCLWFWKWGKQNRKLGLKMDFIEPVSTCWLPLENPQYLCCSTHPRALQMRMAPCRAMLLQVSCWGYCWGRYVGVPCNAMERFVAATAKDKLLEGKCEEQQLNPWLEKGTQNSRFLCVWALSLKGAQIYRWLDPLQQGPWPPPLL